MLLLLALLLAAAAPAALAGGERTPTLVFILAGQSNMGGRWDGRVPPECASSPRTLRLSREPLHAGIDVGNVLGVGPGMSFAHAVLRSHRVGLATGQGRFVDLVRKAQTAVRAPNLRYVDAKGLTVANDNTHLTTQAEVRLGAMLADAYLATLH